VPLLATQYDDDCEKEARIVASEVKTDR